MQPEQAIRSVYPLSDEAWELLNRHFVRTELPKGHLLFKSGRTEQSVYFIERGVARAYSLRDGREITFWIGMEGDPLISYNSYIHQKPGYENIELLEPCVLLKIHSDTLQSLYRTRLDLANWGRKLAERELVKTEEHFISLQCKPAEERYRQILENRPELLQRVALMHIAAYLGVTQVTLSRIRAAR